MAQHDADSGAVPRPLVLLDVDGVLNALGPSPAWEDWRSGHAVAEGRAYPIRWSPSVVTRVLAWTEVAEVQWLTTWGHDANTSLRHLLGMPELPVAGTYADAPEQVWPVPDADAHAVVAPAAPDALTGRWWKLDVVRRLVRQEPGRPLVWVDDDLARDPDVMLWTAREAQALMIVPDPRSGLVAADLDAVDAFVRPPPPT